MVEGGRGGNFVNISSQLRESRTQQKGNPDTGTKVRQGMADSA